MTITNGSVNGGKSNNKPLTVGVFGGSFNPIHLGHGLLAVTTQQTKAVDHVVLVPVYKHPVKTDLLPFEDRVNMCKLAVASFDNIQVSTIERDVGESNGAMLRGLKKTYPEGTKLLYICGDDFLRWMHKPKGLDTLKEVSGIIVQRRLHKAEDDGRFYKEPIDEAKIRAFALKMDLEIDFIYGELPHFSSTLVRRAPGHWQSFLTQSVSEYLDERPHLLKKLVANLETDAKLEEKPKQTRSLTRVSGRAAMYVMCGLEAVHALQRERGCAGLHISIKSDQSDLDQAKKYARGSDGSRLSANKDPSELELAQNYTDACLKDIIKNEKTDEEELKGLDEVLSLARELRRIPVWLEWDRMILAKRCSTLLTAQGPEGWTARLALVEKFNPRIDVLIEATVRALTEILELSSHQSSGVDGVPDLLLKWCQGKEALGRLRAFVCSGGHDAPSMIRSSLNMRERLNQTVEIKERSIARVLNLEANMSSRLAAPSTLHKLLEKVTQWEWSLMGCFAPSTPLPLVHKLLSGDAVSLEFNVVHFFEASSSTLDFLLSFAKALAASACAGA